MIKKQRKELVINYLKKNVFVSTEDLAKNLDIPMSTLRRDLNELEKEKLIIKSHGGVEYNNANNLVLEDFFESKVNTMIEEKKAIAKKAIEIIKPNESIFIDSGSSGYYISKFLPSSLNLKIVTNSIYNILELAKQNHKDLHLIGGQFKVVTGAIIGFEAIQSLSNYNFDKSFIGVNAVDNDENLYTTNTEHAQIKYEIIKHSRETFGLVDSSKYNKKSFYKFANTKDVKLIKIK